MSDPIACRTCGEAIASCAACGAQVCGAPMCRSCLYDRLDLARAMQRVIREHLEEAKKAAPPDLPSRPLPKHLRG